MSTIAKLKLGLHRLRMKNYFTAFFQLLLGVFFSTRSVALVDDLPNMKETKGYKSSARFVVKYSVTAITCMNNSERIAILLHVFG